jgi:hypothetical protein
MMWADRSRLNADVQLLGAERRSAPKAALGQTLLRKRPVYLGAWRTLAIASATASEH